MSINLILGIAYAIIGISFALHTLHLWKEQFAFEYQFVKSMRWMIRLGAVVIAIAWPIAIWEVYASYAEFDKKRTFELVDELTEKRKARKEQA